MSLLVVGSVAFDGIKTPHGEAPNALGGSAVYFSLAASLFGGVRLVGVVGEDFRKDDIDMLSAHGVDMAGLEVVDGGKTFRWSGEYSQDMNSRETLSVDLNVFENFQPKIPQSFRDSRFVFLANGAPVTQLSVLEQVDKSAFVMADTMDLWIQIQHGELLQLLERVDGLSLNDSEALLLTDRNNVIDAGLAILGMGPTTVVIKKGEHGSLLFTRDQIVPLPAYPTRQVKDPTGAGDSFAGAMMGYLAKIGEVTPTTLKQSLGFGTVVASFTVEDFGPDQLAAVEEGELAQRYAEYRGFLQMD